MKTSKKGFILALLLGYTFLFSFSSIYAAEEKIPDEQLITLSAEDDADETGTIHIDLSQYPDNSSTITPYSYPAPDPTFDLVSNWERVQEGTNDWARGHFKLSNQTINRRENWVEYDITSSYDFQVNDDHIELWTDYFYVNDVFTGTFSSNNGAYYNKGDFSVNRTEVYTVRFYSNVHYKLFFHDPDSSHTDVANMMEIEFGLMNNKPYITSSNSIWNEGDVNAGIATWQSLYTGTLALNGADPKTGNGGFMYFDPDTCPGGENAYGSSDVAKNSTITSITNSAGAGVDWRTMNAYGTYTINTTTSDEYGQSATSSRTVKINGKPWITTKDSTWIAGDTAHTQESLYTDAAKGSAEANKAGKGGFVYFDHEEAPYGKGAYENSTTVDQSSTITKIINVSTGTAVDFNYLRDHPGTYRVYTRCNDNGDGSGRPLYSDEVYRTITVTGYKITSSAGNGTISESISNIPMHESRTFTFSPDKGYKLSKLLVDGKDLTASYPDVNKSNTYTFTDIKADHAISAEFAPREDGVITITARISKADWDSTYRQDPSFLIHLSGSGLSGAENQYRIIQFDKVDAVLNGEYYYASAEIDGLSMGKYTLSEIETNKYNCTGSISLSSATASGKSIIAEITPDNGMRAAGTFINVKFPSFISNITGGNRQNNSIINHFSMK